RGSVESVPLGVPSSAPHTAGMGSDAGAPVSSAVGERRRAVHPREAVGERRRVVHHQEAVGVLPAAQSLMSIVVIAIFIITFCVQPFRIPSESMESTLLVGDFLLVDKQAAAPDGAGTLLPAATVHRGDIIVFHDPVDSTLHLVKRVIGLPGDHLRLHNGLVYIN